MKGRAHQLWEDFRRQAAASGNSFGVCRVILLARVIPEKLTPEIDDPALEGRLEQAIGSVLQPRHSRPPPDRHADDMRLAAR